MWPPAMELLSEPAGSDSAQISLSSWLDIWLKDTARYDLELFALVIGQRILYLLLFIFKLDLFNSFYPSLSAPGMGRDPVLRFWTHWSQSCCWRKAQTRFHSQGMRLKTQLFCRCICISIFTPLCLSLSPCLQIWPITVVMLPSLSSRSLLSRQRWHSDLYTSVTYVLHQTNTTPLPSFRLHEPQRIYPTPLPYASATPNAAWSLCHKTVNTLFWVVICATRS